MTGLLHLRPEDDALYCEGCKDLQLQTLDGTERKPAIWLNFSNKALTGESTAHKEARRFDGVIVRVHGTFDPFFHGHENAYPAAITNCAITEDSRDSATSNAVRSNEQNQLRELWLAVLKNSAQAQDAIEALLPKDADADTRNRLMASLEATVFDTNVKGGTQIRSTAQPATTAFGLALTVPKLEPTYPVPGDHGPAYLLPMRAERSCPSGASIGDTLGTTNRLLHTRKIQRLANKLTLIYAKYKDCKSDRASVESPDECKFYRQQLVDMAGLEAVERLDRRLGGVIGD